MNYIPREIVAGFTTKIIMPHGEYKPTAGYTCALAFTGTVSINAAGVSDGSNWVFEVTPALQGFYQGTIIASDINGRYLLETTRVEVRPDPTAIPNGTDLRSDAEAIVAAITAQLKNKATHDQQSLTINGRQITRYSISELMKLLEYYKAEVAAQKKKTPKVISYRFGRG